MNTKSIKHESHVSKGLLWKTIRRACALPLYPIYGLSYLSPRSKKIWAFGTERNFTDNFKYLFLHIANNKKDAVKAIWISQNRNIAKQLKKEGYNAYWNKSFGGIYYALRAKYFFVNENSFDINFWLSGGTKKIVLYHAMPFKKVGYDAKKGKYSSFLEPKGIKKILLRMLIPWGFEKKDFVIATSPVFQKIMASAFRVDENKVIITGSPRNDIFFNKIKNFDLGNDKPLFQKIRDLKNKGKKIIFYLPTWRDTGGNPLADAGFDFSALKDFLNLNNAVFMAKFHIRTDANEKDWQKLNSEEFLVLPSDTDIYQIYPQTDILITDYSSAFIDFLLLDRPTMFFPYDFKKYITEDRELYFDFDEFTPGPKAYNFNELLNQLGRLLKGEDGYEKQREKIKNLCFSYADGNSSERIFKMIYKKSPKICAIVQARMGSERLPGKVLMPICGKPALHHIIERLKSSKLINQIILAVPDTKENDVLEKFALSNSVGCYRGSENEVLERVYLSAKENNSDVIVEITADNPLIDPEIIDLAIKKHLNTGADYSSTFYPSRFLPLGLDAEVLSFQALETAHKNAKKLHQREHVTSYFYENPGAFKINSVNLPEYLNSPDLRLTLDTKEDLKLINEIYARLYQAGSVFKTKEILDLFKVRPELKKINAHIVQKTI